MARGSQTGAKRVASLAGDAPQLASSADLSAAIVPSAPTLGKSRSSKKPGRINLKAVADACIEAGLDPAVEITRVLQAGEPKLDPDGKPVLDAAGNPVYVPLVDPETRLRTLNELLQYCQPKLKAVEVKLSGSLELSGEQLDQRIAALVQKAKK